MSWVVFIGQLVVDGIFVSCVFGRGVSSRVVSSKRQAAGKQAHQGFRLLVIFEGGRGGQLSFPTRQLSSNASSQAYGHCTLNTCRHVVEMTGGWSDVSPWSLNAQMQMSTGPRVSFLPFSSLVHPTICGRYITQESVGRSVSGWGPTAPTPLLIPLPLVLAWNGLWPLSPWLLLDQVKLPFVSSSRCGPPGSWFVDPPPPFHRPPPCTSGLGEGGDGGRGLCTVWEAASDLTVPSGSALWPRGGGRLCG